jgi:K+-transporting ATPase ATPase C chain
MKTWGPELMRAIKITLCLLVIVCGLYPLVVWAFSNTLFPHKAKGSLIQSQGQVLGSELLGQNFHSDRYFHSRPSAAGNGYDATSSGGSNLGATSQKLMDSIKVRAERYRVENRLSGDAILPADAVTASASGLDPDISPENASLQIARIAKARGIETAKIEARAQQYTQKRWLGILGNPRINVLKLNLALDSL